MGNTCRESASRRWRACTQTRTALLVKPGLFVPVRGGQKRRSICTISLRNYHVGLGWRGGFRSSVRHLLVMAGSVDSGLRKLNFACGAADKVLTFWPDEELRTSSFVPSRIKRPSPGLVLKNRMQTVSVRRKTAWTRHRIFREI